MILFQYQYWLGMKDQVRALHFVQENIANFGGDKNRVMIFGTSAGSASVHYHILSPMSKGICNFFFFLNFTRLEIQFIDKGGLIM